MDCGLILIHPHYLDTDRATDQSAGQAMNMHYPRLASIEDRLRLHYPRYNRKFWYYSKNNFSE